MNESVQKESTYWPVAAGSETRWVPGAVRKLWRSDECRSMPGVEQRSSWCKKQLEQENGQNRWMD